MNIYKINKKTVFIIYVILDTLFVGMGMGVPFFCILLGFPVGWYIAKRLTLSEKGINNILADILKYSLFTSFLTFMWMVVIWGPVSTMLLDPVADFANFGIPMILYHPKISFIGWIILMVFISPFLQLLCTIFASNVTLWRLSEKMRIDRMDAVKFDRSEDRR
jgi:ABC-type spermidine/putrescine transport system permease subunit I